MEKRLVNNKSTRDSLSGFGKIKLSRANRSGQVWIETVIYTLIGLAVIGILLAVAKPKIDEIKDRAIIDQSIEIMDLVIEKIHAVRIAPGNRRVVDLKIGKGKFVIDNENDEIYWVITASRVEYSQVGEWVPVSGHLEVLTEEANPYTITLKMDYSVDLRFSEETIGEKELDEAPTPYSLKIENAGVEGGNTVIVLDEE
jgi:hypothetical protein